MVFPATDEIYAAMKAHDLNSGIEAREESSVLHVGINTELCKTELNERVSPPPEEGRGECKDSSPYRTLENALL